MAGDYYPTGPFFPTGPFLRKRARDDEFELAREDFLLGFRERTARAYKADLEDFREWCLANNVDPMTATEDVLDRFSAGLTRRDYARATVSRRISTVQAFLRHLAARGPS